METDWMNDRHVLAPLFLVFLLDMCMHLYMPYIDACLQISTYPHLYTLRSPRGSLYPRKKRDTALSSFSRRILIVSSPSCSSLLSLLPPASLQKTPGRLNWKVLGEAKQRLWRQLLYRVVFLHENSDCLIITRQVRSTIDSLNDLF